jgi:hypothetical protein
MEADQLALIRALNDALRKEHKGGRIVVTRGVTSQGPQFLTQALCEMAHADEFTPENDPWEEHDFGLVTVSGAKLFWKIDYYDTTLSAGAEDPSDAARCARVLTLMLADEY